MKKRFSKLLSELRNNGSGKMLFLGDSMVPILVSGSILTYQRLHEYQINDIVFCKVDGSYIDAHKITQKQNQNEYFISNNLGKHNGWTREVYGKVIHIEKPKEIACGVNKNCSE